MVDGAAECFWSLYSFMHGYFDLVFEGHFQDENHRLCKIMYIDHGSVPMGQKSRYRLILRSQKEPLTSLSSRSQYDPRSHWQLDRRRYALISDNLWQHLGPEGLFNCRTQFLSCYWLGITIILPLDFSERQIKAWELVSLRGSKTKNVPAKWKLHSQVPSRVWHHHHCFLVPHCESQLSQPHKQVKALQAEWMSKRAITDHRARVHLPQEEKKCIIGVCLPAQSRSGASAGGEKTESLIVMTLFICRQIFYHLINLDSSLRRIRPFIGLRECSLILSRINILAYIKIFVFMRKGKYLSNPFLHLNGNYRYRKFTFISLLWGKVGIEGQT